MSWDRHAGFKKVVAVAGRQMAGVRTDGLWADGRAAGCVGMAGAGVERVGTERAGGCTHFPVRFGACAFEDGFECPRKGGIGVWPSARVVMQLVT